MAAGFNFSHGHLITNAGFDKEFENVFHWEEGYQAYLAWKAGYKFFIPNIEVCWHLWEKSYRPMFYQDMVNFNAASKKNLHV